MAATREDTTMHGKSRNRCDKNSGSGSGSGSGSYDSDIMTLADTKV
jgi:hypothetical protein